jgi:hypothetical protein
VRDADEEHGDAAVPDGHQLDRAPLGRNACGLDAHEPGERRAERAYSRIDLRERLELAVGGNARDQRVEVDRDAYDSSFEE